MAWLKAFSQSQSLWVWLSLQTRHSSHVISMHRRSIDLGTRQTEGVNVRVRTYYKDWHRDGDYGNTAGVYLTRAADLPSRRSLRSVRTTSLVVPTSRLSTVVGSRAIPVAGPQTWNDLPEDVTSAESLTTFHRLLKTHLFRKSFPDYLPDINWLSSVDLVVLDWVEHGLTSPPTQYRLYGRQFLQVKSPQPTVSKYWRKKLQRKPRKSKKNTKYTYTCKIVIKRYTYKTQQVP